MPRRLYPAKLMGDSAYGSSNMLGWLVHEHGIESHVTVFDKPGRLLLLPWRQHAQYHGHPRERQRDDPLSRSQTRLCRMRSEVPVLPE